MLLYTVDVVVPLVVPLHVPLEVYVTALHPSHPVAVTVPAGTADTPVV